MPDFTEISGQYENNSVIQKSASQVLFELLDIQANDDVLDLGCGTGHITKEIRDKTSGKIVGIDPSEGMIEKARAKFSHSGITFRVCSTEELDYENAFDVIFCNSAFQWFVDPVKAVTACYRSLKVKGKMAIQAPAKDNYSPNFLTAIGAVKQNEATRDMFSSFNPPWFLRNRAEEYTELFTGAGFEVTHSNIVEVATRHSIEEACKVFESGAAAGYLNQAYYSTRLTQEYEDSFRSIVRNSFAHQADAEGEVRLIFHRIYLLARKE